MKAVRAKRIINKVVASTLAFSLVLLTPSYAFAEELLITGNGAESNNEINIQVDNDTQVIQENASEVKNDVEVDANTGDNEVTGNIGGDSSIVTGDVKTDATTENNVNSSSVTNECCQEEITAKITGNESGSNNSIDINQDSNTDVSVDQRANITNDISLVVNTGGNSASDNISSNVEIETGDIKGQVNAINAPVNTSNIKIAVGAPGGSAKIVENGVHSENKIQIDLSSDVDVFTNFSANLDNFVIWEANTGENMADDNIGGDMEIRTGDVDIQTFIENFANIGGVDINCCKLEPGKPKPPEGEKPGEEEESDGGGGDGDGGGGGGGDGEGGELLSEAAATEAGGPGIIGLADTSSSSTNPYFFFLGLILIAFGGKIATEEVFSASPKNN
jgi:hypothetical protein